MLVRSRIVLFLAVLALTVFPVGWLGEVWHPFGGWLWRIFPDAWTHAVGHILIFLLLGLSALLVFRSLRSRLWLYAAFVLAISVAQEFFQLLYKQRPLVFDDARDLVTDLIGAMAAFIIVRIAGRRVTEAGKTANLSDGPAL